MTEHKGLPVAGYKATQSAEAVALVNDGKQLEERVRRYFDKIEMQTAANFKAGGPVHNPTRLMMAKSHLEIAMMLAYKSVFQPGENRIALPEDERPDEDEIKF